MAGCGIHPFIKLHKALELLDTNQLSFIWEKKTKPPVTWRARNERFGSILLCGCVTIMVREVGISLKIGRQEGGVDKRHDEG